MIIGADTLSDFFNTIRQKGSLPKRGRCLNLNEIRK